MRQQQPQGVEDRPAFNMLLRHYRSAAGLSQEELAERAGVSVSAIGALEQGLRRRPHLHTVRQLAAALGLDEPARAALLAAVSDQDLAVPDRPTVAAPTLFEPTLPVPVTRLVGRQRELADVRRLLTQARLITLTGVGGTGKTRLALQVAAESRDAYPDGIVFVNLAPVSDPHLVPLVLEHALSAQQANGASAVERLLSVVGDRCLLLVLDNFEHVLEAAPVVSALLSGAPKLRVLATSRVLLRLYGEHEYRVPPLSLPSASQPLETSEAVELFVQAAQAARADFVLSAANRAAVAAICERLDGLPLAIELAAARTRLFTPEALLPRLARRLEVLADQRRDLPARQQTLRQTFDWSFALLAPAERDLLAALGVFAGGFTLSAVAAVAPGHRSAEEVLAGLEALHESGLVERVEGPGDNLRFRLLETVREYALARLAESGEHDAARRRHATFYVGLAEQARREMIGPCQRQWLDVLETELDNLRTVLDGCLAHPEEAEVGLRLVGELSLFWYIRGYWDEGQRWIGEALALAGDSGPDELRARGLWGAGAIAWRQGSHARAQANLARSLELWQAVGAKDGMAASHLSLGLTALARGELAAARAHEERAVALFLEAGDAWGAAEARLCLGIVCSRGEPAEATALLSRSLAELRALGDERSTALALLRLGNLALHRADYAAARARLEEAAALFRAVRDQGGAAWALTGLGLVERAAGDDGRARAYLEEALVWARSLGNQERIARTLGVLRAPNLAAAREVFPYFQF